MTKMKNIIMVALVLLVLVSLSLVSLNATAETVNYQIQPNVDSVIESIDKWYSTDVESRYSSELFQEGMIQLYDARCYLQDMYYAGFLGNIETDYFGDLEFSYGIKDGLELRLSLLNKQNVIQHAGNLLSYVVSISLDFDDVFVVEIIDECYGDYLEIYVTKEALAQLVLEWMSHP